MAQLSAKLPKELLHKIFALLKRDKKTLLQLQLTCKEWAQIAKAIFYKSVNLYTNVQRANSFKRALQLPGNSAAHNIRHLGFHTRAFSDDTNLSSIVSCCPNLRSIKQATGLLTDEERCNYYPELLALQQQGHLRCLEEVDKPPSGPNAETANADYIQLMLTLKASITKLYLCNYSSDQPSAFALTEHLPAFNRLKEVDIFSKTGITVRQFNAVLDSKHSCQKIAVNSLLFAQDQHSAEGDSCAGICPLPQIKAAKLEVQSFLLKDIQVIKHMLPRLNELEIFIQGQNSVTTVQDQLERFKQLCEYLSQLDIFNIGNISVSTDLMFELFTNAQNYFLVEKVTVALDEDTKHIGFHISTIEDADMKSRRKGSKPQCEVYLNVNAKQVTRSFCQRLVRFVVKTIKPSRIALHGLYVEEDRQENKILGDCVDYILSHCGSSLKELELYHLCLFSYSNFECVNVLSIDHLIMYRCSMDDDYLTDISLAIAMVKHMLFYRGHVLPYGHGFDMPNTFIETLRLFDIAADTVFKIQNDLGENSRYRYYEKGDTYKRLTKSEYKQLNGPSYFFLKSRPQ
ncbi:hypothetical protein FB192DRAFT_1356645 [Mucor lusitanicus]|uniref:F-box domain-containing protein n=1 Tax=Mucor circinelloides f. lusitanicus TaxID=29924 RepID=A0A8H4BUD4_MUCCL|nr:hypothetical protein FB192DRAFT_1356645 [Mucor lusitanicus]